MVAVGVHPKETGPFFLQRPRGFPGRADDDGGDIVRVGGGATDINIRYLDTFEISDFSQCLSLFYFKFPWLS